MNVIQECKGPIGEADFYGPGIVTVKVRNSYEESRVITVKVRNSYEECSIITVKVRNSCERK